MIEIEVVRDIPGPRQAVWDQYCDHASWTEWAGVGTVKLLKKGKRHRDGVGAIRQVPGMVFEEVVGFDAPERLRYRIIAGPAPMRYHEGVVNFEEHHGRTRIRWHIRFEPTIPGVGWLLETVLRRALNGILRGLEERFAQRAA